MDTRMSIKDTQPMNTNVPAINDQHGIFFDCLRRLEEAMAAGRGASMVPLLVYELSKVLEVHFGSEERLMQSYEYPLRDLHALEHRKAQCRLKDLARRNYTTAAASIRDDLRDWLEAHVSEWDTKLGVYLNANGVTSPEGPAF